MTVDQLRAYTRKELAQMAKRRRISGWHGMRKDELIQALHSAHRNRKPDFNAGGRPHANGRSTSPRGPAAVASSREGDSLDVSVVDPHWLQARWSVSRRSLDRAVAALGIDWHRSRAVLRVLDVTADESARPSSRWVRDVEIHGETDHWFVPIEKPPCRLRLELGYRAPGGRFYPVVRSRTVRIPAPGAPGKSAAVAGSAEVAPQKRNGSGLLRLAISRDGECGLDHEFSLQAELIVHGATHPDAELTVLGKRLPVGDDGRFSLRVALDEGRQVVPAVSIRPGTGTQRTIILAVERNTRELEPVNTDEILS